MPRMNIVRENEKGEIKKIPFSEYVKLSDKSQEWIENRCPAQEFSKLSDEDQAILKWFGYH